MPRPVGSPGATTESRMSSGSLYDSIGVGYERHRRGDRRLAARVIRALGDARSVVNVGAGTGSYEPADRRVTAVEPSREMIRRRPSGAAPVVCARADALPFADAAFDAGLAILTVHHWANRERGLSELARVSRDRVTLLTWDPSHAGFWLVQEYFPEILDHDRIIFPDLEELRSIGAAVEVEVVPIPHDCTDGFLGAYWRRPESYLDTGVRGAISTFSKIANVQQGLQRLRSDLDGGRWSEKYGALNELQELDLGYRLVIAELR